MSSDAPVTMDLCDKCGKPILPSDFSQCSICGGYYHRACFRVHDHHSVQVRMPPLHEWRGAKTP
jgi:predicted sulfurtransferase